MTIINESADFSRYDIGVNVISANTKEKKTSENWSKWQDQSIPVEVHESYKKSGFYNNGIAIITGKIVMNSHLVGLTFTKIVKYLDEGNKIRYKKRL